MTRSFTLILLSLFVFISCQKKTRLLEVESFRVFENFNFEGDTLELQMDLSGGVFEAIRIPSAKGFDGDSVFNFSFYIKNNSDQSQKMRYKIYYQNISYAHEGVLPSGKYNPKSAENFYGSWISDSLISFKEIEIKAGENKEIKDHFFISGNPLNDPRFFNMDPSEQHSSVEDVSSKMEVIRRDSSWMVTIAEKALRNNKSIEDQLRDDALWSVKNHTQGEVKNRRWQNNPRVGLYQFMLVVGTREAIQNLPSEIRNPLDVSTEYNSRINPFFYFRNEVKDLQNLTVLKADTYFRTFAVLSPEYGLYYDRANFPKSSDVNFQTCNSSIQNHKYSHFQQYVNTEIRDSSLNNVDLIGNVVSENYTNKKFQKISQSAERIPNSFVESPLSPCINAAYNPDEEAIVLSNPGNSNKPYRKENAGVEGRIGFTYGKFIGKIKFPEIISDENVWNGITCAYWLKFQSLKDWNRRDSCLSSGYLQRGYSAEEAVYSPMDSYTEIDIEIVKTSKYWPSSREAAKINDSLYDASKDNNLIVTCTNWDLACQDPINFGIGSRLFNGTEYYSHRWTEYYKALTIKTESHHDSTVGVIMYYEIDWRPDKIYWRIGSGHDSMREMGQMDSTITKIPNNQMVPVMSQEFHYGHWWPGTPYPQGNIPFPKDPIKGYLYEVEVR